MKSKFLITLLLTFVLVLAACASNTSEENNENNGGLSTEVSTAVIPVTGDTATPEVTSAPTEAMTATEATTATEAPTSAATQPSVGFGTATAVTVKVSNQGTAPFLVDDQGRTLYIYAKDTSGTSACTDTECTSEWPAVLVTGTPSAGDGVDATLLGTITRDDGQMQATYNNHPLYYYSKDVNPGDTNGKGVDPDWTLVSPTGDPIQ
jgi:predicted lipoprotein with Yx(FWY)xxD motif